MLSDILTCFIFGFLSALSIIYSSDIAEITFADSVIKLCIKISKLILQTIGSKCASECCIYRTDYCLLKSHVQVWLKCELQLCIVFLIWHHWSIIMFIFRMTIVMYLIRFVTVFRYVWVRFQFIDNLRHVPIQLLQ